MMYKNHRRMFDDFIVGESPLEDFWKHIPLTDDRLRGHPILRIPNFEKRVVPYRLHGDAVRIGSRHMPVPMEVVSGSSMTALSSDTWDTRLPFFIMCDGLKWKGSDGSPKTMSVAWRILIWSFACLLSGIWPYSDWDENPWPPGSWRAKVAGQRICGDLVIALFGLGADLDYFCNYHDLQHFNHGVSPCFKCFATRDLSNRPWSDLRPTAHWRQAPVTFVSWFLLADKHLFSALHMLDLAWHTSPWTLCTSLIWGSFNTCVVVPFTALHSMQACMDP